ncbi:MAG: hypothetical protein SGJ27_21615 [Candidatus Melainabacteria bacterium]|nr:hypothetical protein [Candidatus Melainabacteria bacterium]
MIRNQIGSAQISEFGAVLFLLISCIVLPLLNLSIIPVRFAMGKSIVGTETRSLAKSETFSEAIKRNRDVADRWKTLQAIGGITVKDSALCLTIDSTKTKRSMISTAPRRIPPSFLPDGSESPCVYLLDLKVDVEISPLITVAWQQGSIPGLTGPIPIQFHESSAWENLGRDPITGEFYVNQ